jgi:hypothetical protein
MCGSEHPCVCSESPVQGVPLGIYAKSHSTPDLQGVFSPVSGGVLDHETGEFIPLAPGATEIRRSAVEIRLERYALQSVSRSILPKSRTAKCLRVPFRPDGKVDIWYSPEHQSASFGGLVTCGSVWVCPPCSAKVTERRRVEIQAAISAWEALGGSVVLLTLTHGHTQADALADLLSGQQKALYHFFGGRKGRELMDALGRVGHIRAWEVTHGRRRQVNNGWHPHFHILLFLEHSHHDLIWAEDWAYHVWLNACQLAGLPLPNRRYGVTIQDGTKAAAYVAKMGHEDAGGSWGLDAEMTKGHIKQAKDGETPFDLLRAALAGDDPQARALFREFAENFKGKRQLVWSRGLRERFNLDDLSDADLAAAHESDAFLLSSLSRDDWRLILRFDARGELLELCRHGSLEPISRLLQSLQSMRSQS